MSTVTKEPPMAKKMGRPKSNRDDVTVKLDRVIAFKLKHVAGLRRTTLAELLTEIVRGPASKLYREAMKQEESEE